jgi:hypothetical protein
MNGMRRTVEAGRLDAHHMNGRQDIFLALVKSHQVAT